MSAVAWTTEYRETEGANHHLWRNRHTWWVAFTVVYDGHRQERVRRSLGTYDVSEARARRDEMMRSFAAQPGVAVPARRRESSGPRTDARRRSGS